MPTCPIKHCLARIPSSIVMCRMHWRQVPRAIAAEVYDAWNGRKRDPLEPAVRIRHEVAKQAAIAAVNDQQKEKANG